MRVMDRRWALGAVCALVALMAVLHAAWPEERAAVRLAERPAPGRGKAPVMLDATPMAAVSSNAGSGKAHRASARWNAITTDDNLEEIFDAARRSSNPEDSYLAVWIAANCLAVPSDAYNQEAVGYFEEDAARRAALLARLTSIRQRLVDFCKTGDVQGYLDDVKAKRISINSPSLRFKASANAPGNLKLGEWGAVVLSDPQAHPRGFDVWLQSVMPQLLPPDMENSPLAEAVRQELSRRLLGDPPANSVRALTRCMHAMYCRDLEATLPQEQQAQVNAIATDFERKIREQRWSELSPS